MRSRQWIFMQKKVLFVFNLIFTVMLLRQLYGILMSNGKPHIKAADSSQSHLKHANFGSRKYQENSKDQRPRKPHMTKPRVIKSADMTQPRVIKSANWTILQTGWTHKSMFSDPGSLETTSDQPYYVTIVVKLPKNSQDFDDLFRKNLATFLSSLIR